MVGAVSGGTVQDGLNRIGTFVGYDSGGSVTQITSKSTAVEQDTLAGRIITHNQSLPAAAQAAFTLINNQIEATDVVVANFVSAGSHNLMDYTVRAGQATNGGCAIGIRNDTAGALAEAITISFVVIKGAFA
jgi:hypothetical protein